MGFNPSGKKNQESKYGTMEIFFSSIGHAFLSGQVTIKMPVGLREWEENQKTFVLVTQPDEFVSRVIQGVSPPLEALTPPSAEKTPETVSAPQSRVTTPEEDEVGYVDGLVGDWQDVATAQQPLDMSFIELPDDGADDIHYASAFYVPLSVNQSDQSKETKEIAFFYPCADGTAAGNVPGQYVLPDMLDALSQYPDLLKGQFHKMVMLLSQAGTHWLTLQVYKEAEKLIVNFIDSRSSLFTSLQGVLGYNGETKHLARTLGQSPSHQRSISDGSNGSWLSRFPFWGFSRENKQSNPSAAEFSETSQVMEAKQIDTLAAQPSRTSPVIEVKQTSSITAESSAASHVIEQRIIEKYWHVFDRLLAGAACSAYEVRRTNLGIQGINDNENCGPIQRTVSTELIFGKPLSQTALDPSQRLYDALCYWFAFAHPDLQQVRLAFIGGQGSQVVREWVRGLHPSLEQLNEYFIHILQLIKTDPKTAHLEIMPSTQRQLNTQERGLSNSYFGSFFQFKAPVPNAETTFLKTRADFEEAMGCLTSCRHALPEKFQRVVQAFQAVICQYPWQDVCDEIAAECIYPALVA